MVMNKAPPNDTSEALASEDQARRDFMIKAGRFAVLTPPTITALLATSMNSKAIASSGGVYRPGGGGGTTYHRDEGSSNRPGNGWGDQNHTHKSSYEHKSEYKDHDNHGQGSFKKTSYEPSKSGGGSFKKGKGGDRD